MIPDESPLADGPPSQTLRGQGKGRNGTLAEYSLEELVARWEEFFAEAGLESAIIGLADRYPEARSLEVAFEALNRFDTDMSIHLLRQPLNVLAAGEEAIRRVVPPSEEAVEIHLRVKGLPRDSRIAIRALRAKHLGRFIAVEGLVRKATEVRPMVVDAMFQCLRCGTVIKEPQEGQAFREPMECYEDQGGCKRSASATKFKLLGEASRFLDTQKIEIQEAPEGLRGGEEPQRLSAFTEDDLTGKITPGMRVVLSGVLRSSQRGRPGQKSTLFDIMLDVNSIALEQVEFEEIEVTEEDAKRIEAEAADPDIFRKIVASIAPSLYGLTTEKEALALQLFSGVPKVMPDGRRIRGDIHAILVGDPGTAKSEMLSYMSRLSPRGIYATGKAASAAGLCVAGETLIGTAEGVVPIENVVEARFSERGREGPVETVPASGEVVSFDGGTRIRRRPLEAVWRLAPPPNLLEIRTDSGKSLCLTPATRLLVRRSKGLRWIPTQFVRMGMRIAVAGDDAWGGVPRSLTSSDVFWDRVGSIRIVSSNGRDSVYDLTVRDAHAFVANGVLVHNTAAAVRDEFGEGRWTLEAGALVLADKGLACIDEIDKMNPNDRSAIHEALEQQRVSVAKAGITAVLQARCAVLAAANPKFGRFDENKYIAEQIDLPPALLSRFDVIFSLIDRPESERDRNMAEHILRGHLVGEWLRRKEEGKEVPEEQTEVEEPYTPHFDPLFFRKYVAHAKRVSPVMTPEAMEAIKAKYLEIRKTGEGAGASVPITPRQLEAIIRLSEASARARLSIAVAVEDTERAIRITEYWMRRVAGEEGRFDIDIVQVGISQSQREQIISLREVIAQLSEQSPSGSADYEDIVRAAGERGMAAANVDKWLKRWAEEGDVYSPAKNKYKLVERL